MFKFVTEIKTILTFTNGTPFKSRAVRYCCMYCNDMIFTDPADLRNHTRAKHMDDRTNKVDIMMRPHWMNEIFKLDIDNFICVVCCTPIYDWNYMFEHLKQVHQVQLELASRKVIPFKLSADLQCALCDKQFMNYLQLDGHMNSHYDNYVCGNCGDTFLTATRLKSHMRIHGIGKYHCTYCDKVFRLENYRRKHEAVVHKQCLYYKCMYCDTKFGTERDRKNHVTEMHSEKVNVMTCEHCGKTFNWRHYFLSHVRKVHPQTQKKHQCPHCEKQFIHKNNLVCHVAAKHDGEKNYSCKLCDKRYSSRHGLFMHRKKHENGSKQGT